MCVDFIEKLECQIVEPGNIKIIEALKRFDCGDSNNPYYDVSVNMHNRIYEYACNKKIQDDRYYVVWDGEDIYLFFSLQASLVFSTGMIFPEDFRKLETVYYWSKTIELDEDEYIIDHSIFKDMLGNFDGLTEKYEVYDNNQMSYIISSVEKIIKCRSNEGKDNLYVEKSFPSIEIVNFCKNHGIMDKWESSGIRTPIGATLFWYKILPIIKEVSHQIGCRYVSLFAADVSTYDSDKKQNLLNYYENALSFNLKSDLRALKPYYDWDCIFLCQDISVLCNKENDFKRTFLSNYSEDDV